MNNAEDLVVVHHNNGLMETVKLVWGRTKAPIGHFVFWVYLIIGVIFFGGLGIWLEFYLFLYNPTATSTALRSALLTYFPALIGSISLQMIFEQPQNRRLMGFAVIYAFIFLGLAFFLILKPQLSEYVTFPVSIFCCLAAVWIWWIANALNPAFRDNINIEAPLGGPPSASTKGDLKDYQY